MFIYEYNVYIYIYTYTHTYVHIYIYIYIGLRSGHGGRHGWGVVRREGQLELVRRGARLILTKTTIMS